MSSYRSYRPWNSSLSSYSSSASNYRSRYGTDGSSSLSSSSASSAKFSSITPSSYRPSYSSTSGTYRASRAPAVSTTSTTPSYTRTYSTLGKTTDDDKDKSSKTTPSYSRTYSSLGRSSTDDDKDKSSKASTPSYSRAYTSLGKSNTEDDKDKPTKTYTRTYTSSLNKSNHDNEKEKEKKEPSPPKRTTSRLSVKDLSAETKSRLSTAYTPSSPVKKEEKGPPITFNTRYKQTSSSTRGRSRDPSPAADTTTSQTALQRISAQRSRDPSPSISTYSRLSTARSRDPSPVSKSYTDSTVDKSSLSRASVDRNPVNRSYSNSLHVNNSKSPSDKSLNRTLSSSLASTLEKLDREIKSTISNAREKSRDPSPLNTRRPSITSITSSFPRSRDPSPVSDNKYLLSSYRITNGKDNKSREPSPSITLSKTKLRESSPLASISNYRRPSREPSPVESLNKYGSTTSGLSTTSSYNRPSYREPSPQIKLPDIGLSYMTASESSAANAARASRISFINRHSPQKEKTPPKVAIPVVNRKKVESESESSETSSSEEETTESSSEESEEEVRKPEPKIMIQVSTITRGTSPNPPGQTPRTSRRVEVAKTIEKVRERPLNNPPMLDKATQSDRMDDSTRYSKYASTIRSPYSPYSPSPTSYSSRYTSGITSSRYTREQSEVSNADTEKSEASQKSDKFNFALSKSKEGSPVKSDTSRSSSLIKSPSPSKICVSKDRNRSSSISSAKSKTPESSKALPPQSPKAESPVKMSSPKVTNKDFRKSALNMGPTDRQTRSKSSSSDNSSPTVEKTRQQFQKMLNGEQEPEVPKRSIERSVSVESDTSSESTESVEMQSQIQQPQFELSKEEKITAKVEEAKNFLLKTLGNPTFNIRKSPTPETWAEESSTAIPETEHSQSTNFTNNEVSTTLQTKEDKKPWWAIDDTADDASAIENDVTITSGVGTTLQQDNSNQIVNGFSQMTLNPSDNQSENFTSKWSLNEIQSLKSIQRVDSGDRPWWCTSPENKVVASENQAIAQNNDNTSVNNMWEQETQADVSEIQKDDEIQEITKNLQQSFDANALGDRASPEGLEDRRSPYDNVMQQQQQSLNNAAYHIENDFNARPRLFISRHTNIDDLLGGHSVFSPTAMDRPYLEMITPDLVRIHDSNSPPKIVLNKNKSTATATAENDHQQVGALPQKLDDAAIQVYKDGDFGAYLDLESSLAEQSEEIEGLNSSRKNSLVVRTQLSVRVHAIIEKLLTSEGRELRRALFSLKQIFQEDKDLVHGFVGLGGLNCLVQIGSEADQNYQNYILRALGQVMLYVDGMNGVMKHGPTVQWLYTLIASKYRLVVKTALKLLLVFVEYCEGNCYLLVNAIRTVDSARGSLPWTNIMKLLKDYDNADTELLIYATSLINKTLSGLSDQDSFYDESDFLEQQGMESIIQRYMSRTGTDLDLLDQFQLYEAALRFEDGESDEIIRLPDNTVRKTLRLRSSDSTERRKSRRHSTGTAPPPAPPPIPTYNIVPPVVPPLPLNYMIQQQKKEQDDNDDSSSSGGGGDLNGFADCKVREGVAGVTPGLRRRRERAERQKSFQREQEAVVNGTTKNGGVESDDYDTENEDKKLLQQLKREQTVKDLTQKLSNLPLSPQEEKPNRVGDMTGLISKAKEELNKSKNKVDVKTNVENDLKKPEPKKSEIELHWEELMKNMDRDLVLCDLDFRDLNEEDEINVLTPRGINGSSIPPPPPAMGGLNNPLGNLVPPPMLRTNGLVNGNSPKDSSNNDLNGLTLKKTKKTVKLFWKEVREDMIPTTIERTIWDELPPSNVDTLKLEHLFESRAKDLLTKKQQETNKNKEIIVLDHKRSNAINIAMTKLPPPRAIKAAILKMDSTVVTREGIEKLLNMLPTDEERGKIQEAQMLSPELPLGSAEQFLLTLSSISELPARLKLWAFKLDFENLEKEIAEPLMDLKQGVELLKTNLTFKCILSTLLSIGCFLNGQPVKGFQIEYLAKVPEVKDTVHKHSLLHHLCHMVMESQSNTTDLYSEIGPITRASKADFNELAHNIKYLETECKASWDRLKLISKHDTAPQLKQKLIDFLADCAERIIILDVVHRRVINRYHKFLLWLGVPPHRIAESRPNEFCRILSEFALEYRTTRERVHQQIEKKANHRERNKTRGKLIIDVPKFKNGNVVPATKEENSKDEELRQLLGTTDGSETAEINGTFTFRRRRPETQRSPSVTARDESFTDADDEIFESLVKTVTKTATPRPVQRERKRTRNADRKSLRRTLRNGLTEEEQHHIQQLIQGY
ncbi:uncharacterized protein Fhos isoform X2 [Chironomus tepperi]|uniref:uncharacterized protein Fhos isoform X2 n=1 Tax=Chironomus tepperi TaxID=113505 RepID=UPI00391FACA3